MSIFARVSTLVAFAIVLCTIPFATRASTASIIDVIEGKSRVPITMTVPDRDYPLPSLVANEEGKAELTLVVDSAGRVLDAKLKASSGYQRLDEAAVQMARAQWAFWPKEDDEAPAPDTLTVNIDWMLPLDSLSNDAAAPDALSLSLSPSMPGGEPPRTTSRITADDYPVESILNKEQGTIKTLIFVRKDGVPGEVKVVGSSGIPRLDEAAQRMILNRWRYRPATVNGMPIGSWTTADVTFQLELPATPARECREQPRLNPERVPRMSLFGSLILRRQVYADEEGRVESTLLLTQKGWMRLRPIIKDLPQAIRYHPRPTKDGKPAKCWYDADATVKVR